MQANAMTGMNAQTGAALSGEAHLVQSIRDILTTPKGSRVLRRGYGSDLYLFLDAPLSGETRLRIAGAVAEALDEWEPRITVTRVEAVRSDATGHLALQLDYRPRGTAGADTTLEISL